MSEIIEGKPQLAPGVCFVCEMSNPVRYIDTLRDFRGRLVEPLDGRKYVCEGCITEWAQKLGFATPAEVEEMQSKIQVQLDFITELRTELDAFASLKKSLEVLQPKAPAKKAAAAKA